MLTFFRPLERHTTKASTHPTPDGYQFHPIHLWTCRRGKKHLAILHIKIGSSASNQPHYTHTHTHIGPYILTDLFLNNRNNSTRHAHVSYVIIHNIPVVIRFNLAPRSNYCYLLSHYAFFPQNFVGLSEWKCITIINNFQLVPDNMNEISCFLLNLMCQQRKWWANHRSTYWFYVTEIFCE